MKVFAQLLDLNFLSLLKSYASHYSPFGIPWLFLLFPPPCLFPVSPCVFVFLSFSSIIINHGLLTLHQWVHGIQVVVHTEGKKWQAECCGSTACPTPADWLGTLPVQAISSQCNQPILTGWKPDVAALLDVCAMTVQKL